MKKILGYLFASIGAGVLWGILAYGLLSIFNLSSYVVEIAAMITTGFMFCVVWIMLLFCDFSGTLSENEEANLDDLPTL